VRTTSHTQVRGRGRRTVFAVTVVVRAAVPAAMCRWGLCPRCPGVGRCLSGVNRSTLPVMEKKVPYCTSYTTFPKSLRRQLA